MGRNGQRAFQAGGPGEPKEAPKQARTKEIENWTKWVSTVRESHPAIRLWRGGPRPDSARTCRLW